MKFLKLILPIFSSLIAMNSEVEDNLDRDLEIIQLDESVYQQIDSVEYITYKPHIWITVMKSGSMLIDKLLRFLCDQGKERYNWTNFVKYMGFDLSNDWYTNFIIPNNLVLSHHFWSSEIQSLHELLTSNKNVIGILNIRDPRDTCLSLVHFFNLIDRNSRFNYSQFVPYNWDMFTEDEKLSFAISKESTLLEQYQNALDFSKLSNTVLVRFENLVGERGGGSDSLQLKEIQKVADALGINLCKQRLDEIANTLFGDTWTFRKGEIGGYKEAFKDHHYVEFFETFKDVIEPLSKYYDFSI
jgi:hypothetical protein